MKVCIVLRTNRKNDFAVKAVVRYFHIAFSHFFRSSHPEVFDRDFLKFCKICRKAPVLPTGCNFIKERLRCKFLPVIFAKVSRMSSSPELFRVTASEVLLPR